MHSALVLDEYALKEVQAMQEKTFEMADRSKAGHATEREEFLRFRTPKLAAAFSAHDIEQMVHEVSDGAHFWRYHVRKIF